MAYIREKYNKDKKTGTANGPYYYLQRSYRDKATGKNKTEHLAYLGMSKSVATDRMGQYNSGKVTVTDLQREFGGAGSGAVKAEGNGNHAIAEKISDYLDRLRWNVRMKVKGADGVEYQFGTLQEAMKIPDDSAREKAVDASIKIESDLAAARSYTAMAKDSMEKGDRAQAKMWMDKAHAKELENGSCHVSFDENYHITEAIEGKEDLAKRSTALKAEAALLEGDNPRKPRLEGQASATDRVIKKRATRMAKMQEAGTQKAYADLTDSEFKVLEKKWISEHKGDRDAVMPSSEGGWRAYYEGRSGSSGVVIDEKKMAALKEQWQAENAGDLTEAQWKNLYAESQQPKYDPPVGSVLHQRRARDNEEAQITAAEGAIQVPVMEDGQCYAIIQLPSDDSIRVPISSTDGPEQIRAKIEDMMVTEYGYGGSMAQTIAHVNRDVVYGIPAYFKQEGDKKPAYSGDPTRVQVTPAMVMKWDELHHVGKVGAKKDLEKRVARGEVLPTSVLNAESGMVPKKELERHKAKQAAIDMDVSRLEKEIIKLDASVKADPYSTSSIMDAERSKAYQQELGNRMAIARAFQNADRQGVTEATARVMCANCSDGGVDDLWRATADSDQTEDMWMAKVFQEERIRRVQKKIDDAPEGEVDLGDVQRLTIMELEADEKAGTAGDNVPMYALGGEKAMAERVEKLKADERAHAEKATVRAYPIVVQNLEAMGQRNGITTPQHIAIDIEEGKMDRARSQYITLRDGMDWKNASADDKAAMNAAHFVLFGRNEPRRWDFYDQMSGMSDESIRDRIPENKGIVTNVQVCAMEIAAERRESGSPKATVPKEKTTYSNRQTIVDKKDAMSGVNIYNTNLKGADLRNGNFQNSEFVDSPMYGADLRGADFRGAYLDPFDVTGAIYNDDTKWPEPYHIPLGAIHERDSPERLGDAELKAATDKLEDRVKNYPYKQEYSKDTDDDRVHYRAMLGEYRKAMEARKAVVPKDTKGDHDLGKAELGLRLSTSRQIGYPMSDTEVKNYVAKHRMESGKLDPSKDTPEDAAFYKGMQKAVNEELAWRRKKWIDKGSEDAQSGLGNVVTSPLESIAAKRNMLNGELARQEAHEAEYSKATNMPEEQKEQNVAYVQGKQKGIRHLLFAVDCLEERERTFNNTMQTAKQDGSVEDYTKLIAELKAERDKPEAQVIAFIKSQDKGQTMTSHPEDEDWNEYLEIRKAGLDGQISALEVIRSKREAVVPKSKYAPGSSEERTYLTSMASTKTIDLDSWTDEELVKNRNLYAYNRDIRDKESAAYYDGEAEAVEEVMRKRGIPIGADVHGLTAAEDGELQTIVARSADRESRDGDMQRAEALTAKWNAAGNVVPTKKVYPVIGQEMIAMGVRHGVTQPQHVGIDLEDGNLDRARAQFIDLRDGMDWENVNQSDIKAMEHAGKVLGVPARPDPKVSYQHGYKRGEEIAKDGLSDKELESEYKGAEKLLNGTDDSTLKQVYAGQMTAFAAEQAARKGKNLSGEGDGRGGLADIKALAAQSNGRIIIAGIPPIKPKDDGADNDAAIAKFNAETAAKRAAEKAKADSDLKANGVSSRFVGKATVEEYKELARTLDTDANMKQASASPRFAAGIENAMQHIREDEREGRRPDYDEGHALIQLGKAQSNNDEEGAAYQYGIIKGYRDAKAADKYPMRDVGDPSDSTNLTLDIPIEQRTEIFQGASTEGFRNGRSMPQEVLPKILQQQTEARNALINYANARYGEDGLPVPDAMAKRILILRGTVDGLEKAKANPLKKNDQPPEGDGRGGLADIKAVAARSNGKIIVAGIPPIKPKEAAPAKGEGSNAQTPSSTPLTEKDYYEKGIEIGRSQAKETKDINALRIKEENELGRTKGTNAKAVGRGIVDGIELERAEGAARHWEAKDSVTRLTDGDAEKGYMAAVKASSDSVLKDAENDLLARSKKSGQQTDDDAYRLEAIGDEQIRRMNAVSRGASEAAVVPKSASAPGNPDATIKDLMLRYNVSEEGMLRKALKFEAKQHPDNKDIVAYEHATADRAGLPHLQPGEKYIVVFASPDGRYARSMMGKHNNAQAAITEAETTKIYLRKADPENKENVLIIAAKDLPEARDKMYNEGKADYSVAGEYSMKDTIKGIEPRLKWDYNQKAYRGKLSQEQVDKLIAAGATVERSTEFTYDEQVDARVAKAEVKAERLEGWAEGHRAKGEADLNTARKTGDMIPFGQPILVGHHSEGKHRSDLNKIDRKYESGFGHLKTAESYEQRAEGAVSQAKHKKGDTQAAYDRRDAYLLQDLKVGDTVTSYMSAWGAAKVVKINQKSIVVEYPHEVAGELRKETSKWRVGELRTINGKSANEIVTEAHKGSTTVEGAGKNSDGVSKAPAPRSAKVTEVVDGNIYPHVDLVERVFQLSDADLKTAHDVVMSRREKDGTFKGPMDFDRKVTIEAEMNERAPNPKEATKATKNPYKVASFVPPGEFEKLDYNQSWYDQLVKAQPKDTQAAFYEEEVDNYRDWISGKAAEIDGEIGGIVGYEGKPVPKDLAEKAVAIDKWQRENDPNHRYYKAPPIDFSRMNDKDLRNAYYKIRGSSNEDDVKRSRIMGDELDRRGKIARNENDLYHAADALARNHPEVRIDHKDAIDVLRTAQNRVNALTERPTTYEQYQALEVIANAGVTYNIPKTDGKLVVKTPEAKEQMARNISAIDEVNRLKGSSELHALKAAAPKAPVAAAGSKASKTKKARKSVMVGGEEYVLKNKIPKQHQGFVNSLEGMNFAYSNIESDLDHMNRDEKRLRMQEEALGKQGISLHYQSIDPMSNVIRDIGMEVDNGKIDREAAKASIKQLEKLYPALMNHYYTVDEYVDGDSAGVGYAYATRTLETLGMRKPAAQRKKGWYAQKFDRGY